jgi:catalase
MATPEQIIDAMNGVFGKQAPDSRAVHAKGIVLTGTFKPADSASTVTTAPHLQKANTRITVRFSNFAGLLNIPDTDAGATPRGMAIRFHLADGSETDIAAHSFNGFPTPTADGLREFLIALAASGPSAAKPTPIEVFLGSHPSAKNFVETLDPPSASWATVSYFGVNTFKFTNAQGVVTFGRYQIRPEAGEHFLSKDEIAKADPNYLSAEIRERVGRGAIRFNLGLQIADAGDKLEDPSITWPETRRKVQLGTVEIDKLVPVSAAAQRDLLFNPIALPAGIEPNDPMIKIRSDAYLVSFRRRTQH